jgi:hypothetical protein
MFDENPIRFIFALIALFLIAILLACVSALNGYRTTAVGYRDGTVVRLDYTGYIWKTNEGELAIPGYRKGDSNWHFSVRDPDLVNKLTQLKPGTRIRLKYKKIWWNMPWNSETPYIVYSIEQIE